MDLRAFCPHPSSETFSVVSHRMIDNTGVSYPCNRSFFLTRGQHGRDKQLHFVKESALKVDPEWKNPLVPWGVEPASAPCQTWLSARWAKSPPRESVSSRRFLMCSLFSPCCCWYYGSLTPLNCSGKRRFSGYYSALMLLGCLFSTFLAYLFVFLFCFQLNHTMPAQSIDVGTAMRKFLRDTLTLWKGNLAYPDDLDFCFALQ